MHRPRRIFAILLAAFVCCPAVQGQSQEPSPPASPDQPQTISIPDLKKALGLPQTITATVTALDRDDRIVVLRDQKGIDHALFVGNEVSRLDKVAVGDRLQIVYYMSIASRILQPGEAGRTGATEAVVGTAGLKPGGTASYQQRWTVTVNAVDLAQKTVTATGEKGRTVRFIVDDASKLTNLKAGDRVEIDFTAAAIVSMQPAK
jgi:Cu/Ag efflux protein CusF